MKESPRDASLRADAAGKRYTFEPEADMRVSIVITVYNLERFVGEAIASALAQTAGPLEVIVVDDCSTDGSASVIRSFGDRVRHVRLAHNVGALRAALTGLRLAMGDLVAFLDGDDIWSPNKLARTMEPFRADGNVMLVSHRHERVNQHGEPLHIVDETHRNIDRILRSCPTSAERSLAFKRSVLEKRGYWLGSAYVFRRSALDLQAFEVWVESLPKPEHVYLDLVLAPYLTLTKPSLDLGYIDECLFKYRIHGNNSCNDYRDVPRALRAVQRGYFTTLATHDLLQRYAAHPLAAKALAVQGLHLRYYRYLEALYLDERAHALLEFPSLLAGGLFSLRQLPKELARLGSVLVGGPHLFLRLKEMAGVNS